MITHSTIFRSAGERLVAGFSARRATALAAFAIAATCTASGVQAATATGSLSVSATVAATCEVTSTTAVAFGTVGTLTTDVDVTGSIEVKCTDTTAYNIGLGAGSGTGATVSNRKMTGTGADLPYQLFRDADRTLNWGETVATDTVSATADGTAQQHTVYGRIPVQNAVRPGSYTDTVVVTIDY